MNREPTDYTDSSPLLGNFPALRERADRDGFLYFRNFLPREEIFALRALMLDVVESYGWRQLNQDRQGGRIDLEAINTVPENEMRLDIGVSVAAYSDTQRIEMLHKLPHHPLLLNFYAELFGEEAFVHPRHIARMVTGHKAMIPTPPHQDFPLIQGTKNTWTCWFPIGDCPREHGGLSVLRGSHTHGVEMPRAQEALPPNCVPQKMIGWKATSRPVTFSPFRVTPYTRPFAAGTRN